MLKEFTQDIGQNSIVAKHKAELYMQMYEYAKEDFLSIADMNRFYAEVMRYLTTLETQLTQITAQLALHTHGAYGGTTTPPLSPLGWTRISIPGITPMLMTTASATPNTKVGIYSVILNGSPIVLSTPRKIFKDLAIPIIPPLMQATIG